METVKSWSISVKYYIVFVLLCSQKLVAWNQCMKKLDALVCRYKANEFPFSSMHWRLVLFRKAWLRDWFSTCLILRHHCGAVAVYSFWHISALAIKNIFECVNTVNVKIDNFKPFSSGGLTLPTIHFTSIYCITAWPILHFIPRAKKFH